MPDPLALVLGLGAVLLALAARHGAGCRGKCRLGCPEWWG